MTQITLKNTYLYQLHQLVDNYYGVEIIMSFPNIFRFWMPETFREHRCPEVVAERRITIVVDGIIVAERVQRLMRIR